MATPEELDQLDSLPTAAAEVQYLELMIQHHQGGVEMAQAILALTSRSDVRTFAQRVVDGQQAEIELMQSLLASREA